MNVLKNRVRFRTRFFFCRSGLRDEIPMNEHRSTSAPKPWIQWDNPRHRFVVSFLIVGHVLAVAIAPLSFQTRSGRGSSPSVELLGSPVAGYGEFLYLNRGYAFFAPDPGPSHLFQAAIIPADRDTNPTSAAEKPPLAEPVFPDRNVHWPRLLYHRHFMLAEFLTEVYQPPGPPQGLQEIDADTAENWRRSRSRYERVRQSFTQRLEAVHPDATVAIRRLEHLIPDFMDFGEADLELNDPSLYEVMFDQAPQVTPDAPVQDEADGGIMPLPGEPIATETMPESVGRATADPSSPTGRRSGPAPNAEVQP